MKTRVLYLIITTVIILFATITTNQIQERCVYIANNTSFVETNNSPNKLQKTEIIVLPHQAEPSYKLKDGMMIIKQQTNFLFTLFFPLLGIALFDTIKHLKKSKSQN